jgi:predicted ATPase
MMAYPGATIYLFSDTGVHEVDYEETDHYKISKDFFLQRELMLRVLFE